MYSLIGYIPGLFLRVSWSEVSEKDWSREWVSEVIEGNEERVKWRIALH